MYNEAILDAYLFTDIREVLALTEELIEEYNERRSHEAL
ncbi:MAG: transposase [Bacteroidetes bacterium]|nr:transposase [Bacteroidota bacterium]